MPINPTYPGVYVQEIPSGTRSIIGVSTSVTAFIGFFRKGPMNTPVQLFNMGDFEREFGGLDTRSEASYALQQYFANDGDIAWVVRTAKSQDSAYPLQTASIHILSDGPPVSPSLQVNAASPGAWGNQIVIDIDYNSTDPNQLFNLTMTEYGLEGGQLGTLTSLVNRNLSMDPGAPNYAIAVLGQSPGALISLTDLNTGPGAPALPAASGLSGGPIGSTVDLSQFAGHTMTPSLNQTPLSGAGVPVTFPTVPSGTSLYALPALLQSELRKVKELNTATVVLVGTSLQIQLYRQAQLGTSSLSLLSNVLTFEGQLAGDLQLTSSNATANVQRYLLGRGTVAGNQSTPVPGGDGALPGGSDLVGSSYSKTGMYSLDAVDVINILSIPSTPGLSSTEAAYVIGAGTQYCEQRMAFMIVDPGNKDQRVNSVQTMRAWLDANASLGSPNNAVYFPNLYMPDPLNQFRLREVSPSGTMAGLYARTDAAAGVWNAAAGIDAVLKGITSLEYTLTDDENGVLNPLGVNCLRNLPVYGNVIWGARTMYGSDVRASEWKYIPVRRLALFLELSLKRGLQWVVFEPNGEILWRQIALNVGAFMQSLYLRGAFKGTTPNEAYFVACDSSTTSQNDIDSGIVNVVVGFAPLKPTEFVILQLQQLVGQSNAG